MKKIFMHLIIIVLGFYLTSCQLPQGDIYPKTTSAGSLVINIKNTASRMLLPNIDMNPGYYLIKGAGPFSEVFSVTTPPQTTQVDGLTVGEWTITITVYNSVHIPIGVGTATTNVADNAASTVSITVSPFDGEGTLDLTVNWIDSEVERPELIATLTPLVGASRDLNFVVSQGSATFNAADIPTGYYTLSLKLLNNGIPTMGATELVRIIKDMTTTGSYTFDSVNQTYGTIDVDIIPEIIDTSKACVYGNVIKKIENETISLRSEVKHYSGGLTYNWYVDGNLESTNPNFTFDNTWALANYRVDLLIFSTDGTHAASESIMIEVGPFVLVKSISIGGNHTMILKDDNSLWATGLNTFGQLGDGTTINKAIPVQIMTDVKAVSAGTDHTMILKTDGSLWATGCNSQGQLGDGTTINITTPVQIMTGVTAISAGRQCTMIIKDDQSLWGLGHNHSWQFGTGGVPTDTPTQLMTDVKSVSIGDKHTMVIKNDGSLWAAGMNDLGQLGLINTASLSTFKQIMTNVASVSTGFTHTMVLKEDNSVWGFGANMDGQLGDNNFTYRQYDPVQIMSDVKYISAGYRHTMIIKNDGSLWATGGNISGALTFGATTAILTPKQVMTNVESVSAGGDYSIIIKGDGSVWAAGNNQFGQLGDGSFTNKTTPIQVEY